MAHKRVPPFFSAFVLLSPRRCLRLRILLSRSLLLFEYSSQTYALLNFIRPEPSKFSLIVIARACLKVGHPSTLRMRSAGLVERRRRTNPS